MWPAGGRPIEFVHNVYDAAGQLTQVQKAYGTSLQQNYATYSYSLNGKQLSVTDANSNLAAMAYDGFDRQVRWTFPSPTVPGQTNPNDYEAYTYDAVGNRTSFRKRDNTTLTYSYDGTNKLIQKNVPASATGAAGYSVFYGYDVNGLQLYARFGSASGAGISTTYDGFGRVASTTTTMDGTARTLNYGYDALGNRTHLAASSGSVLDWTYDATGAMTGLYAGGQLVQVSYDLSGRRQALTMTNGGTSGVSYGYDALGRLTSLGHDLAGTASDQSFTFGYNPAKQIVSRTSGNDAYAYTGATNVSRGYSVNGLNQYTAVAGNSYSYDANGNLTFDGTSSYVYDAENRLVSRSTGVSLSYDPNGRLWQVSASTGSSRLEYDGDKLIQEYDGNGTRTRLYGHGAGADEPLAWWENVAGAWQFRFLHADHQGSVIAATDGGGNMVGINAYDPWGVPYSTSIGTVGRFGYTGQAWLPELGMYYYKARIYSPMLGRFLQTDPIGYKDQVNLYAYVGNDPVDHSDVSGTCTGSLVEQGDGQCLGGGYVQGLGVTFFVGPGDSSGGGTTRARGGTVATPSGRGGAFVPPTNPPRAPPFTGPIHPAPRGGGFIGPGPNGTTIRWQPASAETAARGYPTGYWVQTNSGGQQIDPSTGNPPSNVSSSEAAARTHVPIPEAPKAEAQALRQQPTGWLAGVRLVTSRLGAALCLLFCEAPGY